MTSIFPFNKFSHYSKLAKERRISGRLTKYWAKLSDGRMFPAEIEINPSVISDMWDYCFIVKADNSCKKEDYQYRYLGQKITDAYKSELRGINIQTLVSTDPGNTDQEYEKVLAWKRPVINNSESTIGMNRVIRFRQVLLPLGDDGINITSILGCMSYRITSK
jgi:hypothetical protein